MNMKSSAIIDKVVKFFVNGKHGLADKQYVLSKENVTDGERDWSIINAGLANVPYRGQGERVGILDTGVDKNHRDLFGRVELMNFIEGSADTDENGHGTFCAGEILANGVNKGVIGVAPMATALCCKVLYGDSRDGDVNFNQVLHDAIQAAWKNGCGVLSMSIGFSPRSRLIEEALNEAVKNGVIPIAASGNDGMMGSKYKSYPASYVNCISVAAANEKGMPTWFSTEGIGEIPEEQPEVAVASKEYYWGCLPNYRYGRMIGTSMACPIIAGTALLWRESMRMRGILPKGSDILKEFRAWLKSVSVDTNNNGWDSSLGWGVLSIKDGDL